MDRYPGKHYVGIDLHRVSPYKELLIFMGSVIAARSRALSLEVRRSLWFVIDLAWVTRPSENTEAEDQWW